jgi:hypothetical protein
LFVSPSVRTVVDIINYEEIEMIRTTTLPTFEKSAAQVSDKQSPTDIIRDLFVKRYPEAPTPTLKSCRAYYGRFVIQGDDGTLSAPHFQPEVDYVLDFGFESLVVFRDIYEAVGACDPTFPHWANGQFYCAEKEEADDILFPFTPRDLLVGTTGISEVADLQGRINSLGCNVDSKVSVDLFKVTAPAFQENATASKIQEINGIRYAGRNVIIRGGEGFPGWILDRIF